MVGKYGPITGIYSQEAIAVFFEHKAELRVRNAGVDLILPPDLEEGEILFSTKAPGTFSKYDFRATDNLGIDMAGNSASAYTCWFKKAFPEVQK